MFRDDLWHAWRRLGSKRSTMALAVTMLALAVGLTTAMFTVADSLLLRPIPFADPERLAQLYMSSNTGGRISVAPAVFRAWRASAAFEAVESAATATALIETGSGPVARPSAIVTRGLFDMLGARALRGRLFQAGDGQAGAMDRALISEDLWRTAFGSDQAIVGRQMSIDGEPVYIIGILPAEFRFPAWNTEVWRPIDFDALPPGRSRELPVAFVRFAAALPRPDAIRLATDAAHEADPTTGKLFARPQPLAGRVLDPYYQRAVPLLFGGVGFVFLVLCANATSLLLVRLADRRREFSLCVALGASRRRLLRQAVFESAMLGAAGMALGVAVAWALVSSARAFLPEAALLRTLNPLNLDLRALAAASAAGAAATLVAGVWPAWFATRIDPSDSLKSIDRGGTDTRATRSLTRGLVMAEIALACALLAGAALLVRSFVNLSRAERGLDAGGVVIARISLPAASFADPAARFAMTSTIEAEMRKLTGVERAALSFGLPPDGGAIHFGEGWQSDVAGAPPMAMQAESYDVGPDFFELYGIPLLQGRTFRPSDTSRDVIVGERLAARLWPDLDPVGRSFRFAKEQLTVIGLVREIHHPSVEARLDRPEFYRPLQPAPNGRSFFMMSLRCGAACPGGAAIRQQLLRVSPAVQVLDVGPLEAEYFEQIAGPRAAAALGFAFATIAVIAAAGGLFGVLTYVVGRRQREFGVRTALGASPQQIRRLVLREGLVLGVVGAGVGTIGGLWLTRGLASLQYGVSNADVSSWLLVVGVLTLTTVGATWRPASRAARVDPVMLLRQE